MSKPPVLLTKPFAARVLGPAQSWVRVQAKWWGLAILFHVLGLGLVGLLAGTVAVVMNRGEVPLFDSVMDTAIPETDLTQFEMSETPLEPPVLDAASLALNEAQTVAQDAPLIDNAEEWSLTTRGRDSDSDIGFAGSEGFTLADGLGAGSKNYPGWGTSGGRDRNGFDKRNAASREAMAGEYGGTKGSERAVGGGLNWLARHQNADGSWSFQHAQHSQDAADSTGEGKNSSVAAATAFALLPYLAAGQTHKSKGPHQKTISDGIAYLGRTVKPDGNLQGNVPSMYAQGVATIVLCEAYGMSHDQRLKAPAQKAVEYICRAQHPELGGWHYYTPGTTPTAGDLSVVGWQLMALKSAKMAGLEVPPVVLERASKFLKSVSKGEQGGLGSYMVDSAPTPAMTSVGLLSKQFLGAKRSDPAMAEGMRYMMANMPGVGVRNSYYFYYATQVMHNLPGPEWDEWNRATRRYLIDTQEKEGSAAGSWNPELPTKDTWADEGGRLLITSVNTLNLEVYYRYLPLYKLDKTGEKEADMPQSMFDAK